MILACVHVVWRLYWRLMWLCCLPSGMLLAQESGYLELRGQLLHGRKPVGGVEITLHQGRQAPKQFRSDPKGRFLVHVPYGQDATLQFAAEGFVTCHVWIETGALNASDRFISTLFNLDPPLVPRSTPNFPVDLFEQEPFARVHYTGNNTVHYMLNAQS